MFLKYPRVYISMYIPINRSACGNVPHVALVRWNCKVEFGRRGCLRLFCRCLADSVVKREDFRCQNGADKVSKGDDADPF